MITLFLSFPGTCFLHCPHCCYKSTSSQELRPLSVFPITLLQKPPLESSPVLPNFYKRFLGWWFLAITQVEKATEIATPSLASIFQLSESPPTLEIKVLLLCIENPNPSLSDGRTAGPAISKDLTLVGLGLILLPLAATDPGAWWG